MAMGDGSVLIESESGNVNATAGSDLVAVAGGDITLDSTGDTVVNGGSAKVARISAGDKTESHDHTASFTLTAPSGGGPVTGSITISTKAGLELTTGGAARFKA
jgi:hypothetical protein